MASHGNYGARFMELLARAGPRVEASPDGWSHSQDLSFWVATLLPLNISQRLDFSRMTSTAARLQVGLAVVGVQVGGHAWGQSSRGLPGLKRGVHL